MTEIILDDHKLAWHPERVNAWLKGERIAPITVDIALSRACTYNCMYCYGQLQKHYEKQMSKKVIFRFLDDAAEIGVKAIMIVSDGESTCSPHLYEAIGRGKKNGLNIGLSTNGYLLKDEKLPEILSGLTWFRFVFSAGERERYKQIMGSPENGYDKVYETIKKSVEIKKEKNFPVTIGIQMVLMPDFGDQIMPFAKLGKELGVDYAVIKHCCDDEAGSLGIDYTQYSSLIDLLKKAEALSDDQYLVKAKWSKITAPKREYKKCYGPPFIMQISGSGLVAPCGHRFKPEYQEYHIGNIVDTSFKELWQSDQYWQVMDRLAEDYLTCWDGTLCLQHQVNQFLWDLKQSGKKLKKPAGKPPGHVNFI